MLHTAMMSYVMLSFLGNDEEHHYFHGITTTLWCNCMCVSYRMSRTFNVMIEKESAHPRTCICT